MHDIIREGEKIKKMKIKNKKKRAQAKLPVRLVRTNTSMNDNVNKYRCVLPQYSEQVLNNLSICISTVLFMLDHVFIFLLLLPFFGEMSGFLICWRHF